MTEEKRLDNSSPPNVLYDILWDYDEVGNRKYQEKTVGAGTMIRTDYTYNNANQLITEQVVGETNATTYQYDANGNQTQKWQGTTTQLAGWAYDADNRQVSYRDMITTANNTDYSYDAMGRRISRTNTQTLTSEHYLYDGANIVADYNSAGTLTASYVTPFLDQNLVKTIGTDKYYYFQDGLGSVRNIIDSTQAVKNTYDYYAFGEAFSVSEHTALTGQRYRFTGREWDDESGLQYNRERYYNPYVGRFTRRDPIGYLAGLNLYTYALNNPVNRIDPFGLEGVEYQPELQPSNLVSSGQTMTAGVLPPIAKSPIVVPPLPSTPVAPEPGGPTPPKPEKKEVKKKVRTMPSRNNLTGTTYMSSCECEEQIKRVVIYDKEDYPRNSLVHWGIASKDDDAGMPEALIGGMMESDCELKSCEFNPWYKVHPDSCTCIYKCTPTFKTVPSITKEREPVAGVFGQYEIK